MALTAQDLIDIRSVVDAALTVYATGNVGLTLRYIKDSEGDFWQIDPPSNGASYGLEKITVLPVVGSSVTTTTPTYISIKTNEAVTVAVALVNSSGTAVSTVGMTLELVFESGSTEVVIANADITKSTTGFSFTVPSTLNSAEKLWSFVCRKTTDEAVLCAGKLEVIYAPNN